MTYLDGRLYVADYRGGAVIALDTSDGTTSRVVPFARDSRLAFAHPGDVKARDGLLWVLNNGAGEDALWAMHPSGEVVRRVALEDKTAIAVGLAFTRDGDLVVSDMYGGRVLRYGPDGGRPLSDPPRALSNPMGVATGASGNLYVAVGGKLLELDPAGAVVATRDPGCPAVYPDVDGEFLDLTCGERVVTLDLRSGRLRNAPAAGHLPSLAAARGLARAPDGTLFLLDRGSVLMLRVKRP
jgi:sugar lactone lactonase YvrE